MPCSVKDMGTAIMTLQQPKVSIRTGMGAVSPTARRGQGEARWPPPLSIELCLSDRLRGGGVTGLSCTPTHDPTRFNPTATQTACPGLTG